MIASGRLLEKHVVRTPQAEFPALNAVVGGRVLLKLETFQRTHSFKFRGAMSRLLRLDANERTNGVVAWSSCNSVSDDEVRRAMRFAFDELRLVAERGGAAALAAMLAGKHECGDGDGVTVAIISGGNVDPELFASL